ncbi:MAG: UDP-3-O-acyl-N-acetylglucosamine deacetylase [Alphaproteobacteria bacterium]|nr:UDP-3-O-acyl-N-acetylglucosamine deacetylase [Alphaproteobacteria bacterium]MDB5740088.1 UDP-3-O-acyl-N-acetylglucosamine deacetylase [Alphaproteobacteria bacterium]
MRTTLARPVQATGIALHAGVPVTLQLKPAASGAGIVFRRADLGVDIPARYDLVGETRLGTVIVQDGASVGVIEHLMAAAAGLGIDDLLVALDGPEPPILDGDALSFLTLLESAGLAVRDTARTAIKLLRPVTVEQGDARASLLPAEALSYHYSLSYPVIGEQSYDFVFSAAGFKCEIAPARTFGFVKDLDALNRMNLARGATLDNTLALDDSGVVNKDRQRFTDEFVRHKILDAIGDMALAGAALIARFEGVKSGHATNNALLRALFSDPANYRRVEL